LAFAAEAKGLGRGGIEKVHQATGMARSTIARGIRELDRGKSLEPGRVRRAGGGRKKLVEKDPKVVSDLEALVEPSARGDPESPLRWTFHSLRVLAHELEKQGHDVSHVLVGRLLGQMGYSLQSNDKTKEGAQHPDRNAQFEFINKSIHKQQRAHQPVISVDTKKKELVGDFANRGREWRPKGMPEKVRVHDFIDKEKGKAIPYGVYDLTRNDGWVSVGTSSDTAEFAVNTIRRWWNDLGRQAYPRAKSLLITADCGGSNGNRTRLWKAELHKFALEKGLRIHVRHFPPGTSKWNKIEHRLFAFITKNWRGRPLESLATIVNLIGSTRTATGLRVRAVLDQGAYEKGRKVSTQEMARIAMQPETFHGEWNYTILPKTLE
jgi:hypothetical protein